MGTLQIVSLSSQKWSNARRQSWLTLRCTTPKPCRRFVELFRHFCPSRARGAGLEPQNALSHSIMKFVRSMVPGTFGSDEAEHNKQRKNQFEANLFNIYIYICIILHPHIFHTTIRICRSDPWRSMRRPAEILVKLSLDFIDVLQACGYP